MESRFLFRGQAASNTEEVVIGSLLQINDKFYIHPSNFGDLDDIDFGRGFVEVINPQQCIGLKDKNLDLVFEGDFVAEEQVWFSHCAKCQECNAIGEVIWGKYDGLSIMMRKKAPCGTLLEECYMMNDYFCLDSDHSEHLKIVGNIYNNPELKEKKNDESSEQ